MGFKVVHDPDTPTAVYNFRIYLTAIIISFGALLFGYCASFIGTTITVDAFRRDFGLAELSSTEKNTIDSNIVSAFQACAIGGAILGYPIMETFGRKVCLIVAGVIFEISAILQVAATHQLGMIYAGRAIGGFSVGIVTTVCPVYLAEVSPPAIRGRLVGFYEIAYQLAAVVGFWINYGIEQTMNLESSATWRIPMAVQLIPGGLLLLGVSFLKESPRYLLKMNRADKAMENLSWLRTLPSNDRYVENELSATVMQINREREVTARETGGSRFSRYFKGIWHEVSKKGIRNRMVIGAWIMIWQNMSGINAINFYSPTLFADIGISNTSLYTGIYGVLKALASLVFFAFLVDSLGRRLPLIWGGTLSGLCLIYVAVYIKVGHPATQDVVSSSTAAGGKGAIAFILLYAIFYCMGWNGLAWVICAEIYPTNIRGFCAAWTAFWQWVMQLVIVRTTTLMSENLGWGMFLLFALFNFASVVFTIFFIPETKGRTLEDMDAVFGYTRYNDALQEKSESTMVEDTAKATQVHAEAENVV
ncbi:hypothetical protein GYMLUDRAFT_176782 [Collybiopsis luxurians FD-317 M1]|uniref:Unplaced genomic scaffold GYMLUscaffold_65, whole genome shotgun sequence n=1 Tax=Collybiopsis luxurians FD-317 M1 TaxID=944289 RepID=A0A0D0BY48_9AGAR|nr:hypothetical protein GYMLUDRAFT_176782 [Collybiopsis luxurians FD-317 M1]